MSTGTTTMLGRRIGLVSNFPPPPGGLPVQAVAFENGFRRHGWTVRRIETSLRGGGLVGLCDRTRFLRTFVRWPVYLVRLLITAPRVDVLHVMSMSGLTFFLFTAPALLVGACLRRPVVVHYHGGAAAKFLERWGRVVVPMLRRADTVLVPSAFLRDVFDRVGVASVVVPNVGDWGRFTMARGRVAPVFLVARQLQPEYRIDVAIRAFARVVRLYGHARLVIAGDGPERGALERLCDDLDVREAVEFLGDVRNEQMPAVYHRACIALNPSSVDNLPISILEAFAAGLPVVTTNAGGIPYLVEDRRNGLMVPVGDDEAMARACLALLADPVLAEHLRVRGRESILRYSWPSACRALSGVRPYAALAGQSSAA